ncbi:MAG: hypothetical protein M1576_03185 [Deltaproteobacteria bacterium]|nr:hypothetical protein [Deltaproteobacteria bacterium]
MNNIRDKIIVYAKAHEEWNIYEIAESVSELAANNKNELFLLRDFVEFLLFPNKKLIYEFVVDVLTNYIDNTFIGASDLEEDIKRLEYTLSHLKELLIIKNEELQKYYFSGYWNSDNKNIRPIKIVNNKAYIYNEKFKNYIDENGVALNE